jgi:exodeoxyribonuclease VII large subunit
MKSADQSGKAPAKKIKSGAYQPGFDALKVDEAELLRVLGLESVGLEGVTIESLRLDAFEIAPEPERSMPPGTLTVESVALYIKSALEDDTNLQKIWVLGEISSVSRSAKGTYFTLQDPESNQSIACVVWNSTAERLQTKPQQGEQVLVLANVKTYSQQSKYQLQVIQIRSAGEGLQALRYQQLRDRLAAEGLFDPENKQSLPQHPQTIAVVTSPNAAAWGDIQTTLLQRYPGLRVLLSPATVQGETAPPSIAKAIARVIADGRAEVLIVARGGGAVEDLACFNDERVVRAIATCPIPVISGIGHDRDESLADLAADYAAHTPTAAAETVVPDLTDLAMQHLQRAILAQDIMNAVLDRYQTQLQTLQRRLHLIRPDRQLDQAQEKLHWLKQQIVQSIRSHLTRSQSTHDRLQTKLTALDPHAVLERGYAVVRAELARSDLAKQQVVKSVDELTVGQTIEIQLGQGKGKAIAQIMEICASQGQDSIPLNPPSQGGL